MSLGDPIFNSLVLLAVAIIGLVNTWMTIRAKATVETTKAIAVETREIVQKTEAKADSLVSEVKQERAKMAVLLDDALGAVGKRK